MTTARVGGMGKARWADLFRPLQWLADAGGRSGGSVVHPLTHL